MPQSDLLLMIKGDGGSSQIAPLSAPICLKLRWLMLRRPLPGFPVQLDGIKEPSAAFREESPICRPVESSVQESGVDEVNPG